MACRHRRELPVVGATGQPVALRSVLRCCPQQVSAKVPPSAVPMATLQIFMEFEAQRAQENGHDGTQSFTRGHEWQSVQVTTCPFVRRTI